MKIYRRVDYHNAVEGLEGKLGETYGSYIPFLPPCFYGQARVSPTVQCFFGAEQEDEGYDKRSRSYASVYEHVINASNLTCVLVWRLFLNKYIKTIIDHEEEALVNNEGNY